MSGAGPGSLPPGPPLSRRISLRHARNLRSYVRDPLAFVAGRFATYGDVYCVRKPGQLLYVFKHPDHLHELLVSQADGFHKADIGLEKILGRGLLTSDGALWKQRRRMIQPSFSRARIVRYAQIVVERAEAFCAREGGARALDMSRAMARLTLSIVAEALFSHQIDDDDAETDEVAASMSEFQEVVASYDPLPDWMPTPGHLRRRRALERMDELLFGVVDARLAARADGRSSSEDLLDALLDAVDPEASGEAGSNPGAAGAVKLDREALRDELVTLYLAGHETTANAISWTWMLLAQHPQIEARLVGELREVLGDRRVRVEDLDALPYLRAVCHEVLRLYPPAYVLAREAIRDVEIGGWILPAGQRAVAWIYMTHHDPRWYPDPERFDPERFMGEQGARPKLAWLPFGGGARMCVGKHFALLEMQLLLATLVRRLRFALDDGVVVRPRPRITLSPRASSGAGLPGVSSPREVR